jgi:RNA polymerase sigma factor (sigma-70 family)
MRRVVLLESAGPVGDGAAERAERDALWHALLAVPPRQRAALVLRYYEDMDEQAIATALNVTVGTVRSQLAKGLQHLRKLHEPSEQMGARRDA